MHIPRPTFFPPAFRPMKGFAVHNDPNHKHGLHSIRPALIPMRISVKLDGIRGLTLIDPNTDQTCIWSGQLIKLPSEALQRQAAFLPPGIEVEIMARHPTNTRWMTCYEVQSACVARKGVADFRFFAFDYWVNSQFPYQKRYDLLHQLQTEWPSSGMFRVLDHIEVNSSEQIAELSEQAVISGYEGTILRHCGMTYKHGRSTFSERGMLKIKPFVDDEAVVVGFEELYHNNNAPIVSELGYLKRSSHLSQLEPGNKLGALIVSRRDKWNGKAFKIGIGFTDHERITIWQNKQHYINQIVTFKYQEHGTKDVPRIPVFKQFRNPIV